MAIRKIVTKEDEILRKTSRPVENFDARLWALLDDMKETLHKNEGVGLAAPQVGILRRVVVIDAGDGVIELVNPVIIESNGEQEGYEGCLSCPKEYGLIKRPMNVTVEAFDRKGRKFMISGEGLKARAFCHEIDHLNGILIYDLTDTFVNEKDLTKE